MAGIMFERIGTDRVGHLLRSDSIRHMPEIGIERPLAELCDGVDLTPTDTAALDPAAATPA